MLILRKMWLLLSPFAGLTSSKVEPMLQRQICKHMHTPGVFATEHPFNTTHINTDDSHINISTGNTGLTSFQQIKIKVHW